MLHNMDTDNVKPPAIKLWKRIPRDERKNAFLDALKMYGYLSTAADALGLHRDTVFDWRQADQEFDSDVKYWLETGRVERIEAKSYLEATTNKAAFLDRAMLLKALNPDRYKDRIQVDMSVTVSAQLGTARGIADIRRDRLKASNSSPVINLDEQEEPEYATLEEEG